MQAGREVSGQTNQKRSLWTDKPEEKFLDRQTRREVYEQANQKRSLWTDKPEEKFMDGSIRYKQIQARR
jgi:hypothetical protein